MAAKNRLEMGKVQKKKKVCEGILVIRIAYSPPASPLTPPFCALQLILYGLNHLDI